jgi:hypothetical protein
MDSNVKILQKYISLTEKNKSSHWKYYLNSKSNFYNINNSLGLGSYNKKNLKKIIHYFLSRITFGRYIFLTSSFRRYKKIYDKNKRQIDTDCIRHIYTFNLLRKKIKKNTIKKICIIGDGKVNGLIGCLLHYPKAKIYSINLAETLIQDYLIYKKMNPRMAKKIQVVERERDLMNNKRIFLIPSCLKNYLYKKKINLFINIASFQEMQITEIKRYFKIIKSNKCYLYLANREHKRLPDGKIISFNKYPFGKGKKLILEDCSWHQKFYQFTYPFFRKYEGNIKHCLLSYK